tara:strand:+ start:2467 stop:3828 length:1362 start_codon:yes stop_codon:yes gene_type:complete
MSEKEEDFPNEMKKVIKDFITDILNTFPEYHEKLTDNELEYLKEKPDIAKLKIVLEYFKTIYPERFFDILYENEEIFKDKEKNTFFLTNIDFKEIWKSNISDNTKTIIWKYLQLILFSLSKNMNGAETFGNAAKMFEAIDEKELKNKLEEVISSMNNVFDISNNNNFEEMMKNMTENMTDLPEGFQENMKNMFENTDISNNSEDFEENMKNMFENMDGLPEGFQEMMKNMTENMFKDVSSNEKNIPNPNDVHNHLNSLMGGKIGKLAQEIADETASELDIDTDNITGIGDIFSKLFKNPGQLMNMIKKVSTKLDEKLKSGDIKESELMEEANELVEKMKNTPGMKDMEKMLGKMGMGGGNGKANMNLFQSMMKSNMKKSSQKERMLNKLKKRQQEKDLMEKIKKCVKQNNEPTNQEMQDYDEYIQKTFNIDNSKMQKSTLKKKKKKKKKKKQK